MLQTSRREFAKWMGGAALAVPLAPSWVWTQEGKPAAPARSAEAQPTPQAEPPKPPSKLKLSKEQEERVKQAIERRDRQLTAMRSRALPYDAEPAFVFHVRMRPRQSRAAAGH